MLLDDEPTIKIMQAGSVNKKLLIHYLEEE